MNRHYRRKKAAEYRHAAAQERRARAFEAGKKAAQTGELPPGYLDLIQRMARLIVDRIAAAPRPLSLTWHDMLEGPPERRTLIVGPLHGDSLKYVAGSPDAIELMQWVDEQTGREATLYQATWALKFAGQLPGGPDTYDSGNRVINDFVRGRSSPPARFEPVPCPHCGKKLDAANSDGGHSPTPGALNICLYCQGLSQFTDTLGLTALGPEFLEHVTPEERAEIETAMDMMRQAHAQLAMGTKPRGPADA